MKRAVSLSTKGALHKVENGNVEKPVTFISIYAPAGMDEYFNKLAQGLETGQLAHGGREALQKEYGVVFEGPSSHKESGRSSTGTSLLNR
jgi:hypothetical protein